MVLSPEDLVENEKVEILGSGVRYDTIRAHHGGGTLIQEEGLYQVSFHQEVLSLQLIPRRES
jgi:hypothetical protein